jgi:hypothetical protein
MDVTITGLNLDETAGTGISVIGDNDDNLFNLRLTDGDLENNVAMSITGDGGYALLVDNVDVNSTVGGDIAFALDFTGTAQNYDVTFRNSNGSNTNDFDAGNAQALSITSSGGAKQIDLLVEESTFDNNSAAATAAEFIANGTTLLNATIRDNVFTNAGAGDDFVMRAAGTTSDVRLNLGDDSPALFNSAGEYVLIEDLGGADFQLFDRNDTLAGLRNNGTVSPESPAGVANPGAFTDMGATPPPLPTVP